MLQGERDTTMSRELESGGRHAAGCGSQLWFSWRSARQGKKLKAAWKKLRSEGGNPTQVES